MKQLPLKSILLNLTFLALFVAIGFLAFNHGGNIFDLRLQTVHAQPAPKLNDLHTALTSPGNSDSSWLFGTTGVWNLCLGIANAFVAVILFFFAFVNIAHIQYDTYQLKKTMPNLIIGIILANFSLVIGRMIVDLAQVLTATFLTKPESLAHNIMCGFAMKWNPDGSGFSNAAAWITSGVSLIVLILVGLAMTIAVLILAFLLWIRKMILIILVAVSPIAFVMFAFPPTEQYFKQWWSWFMNWAFMGPIVIFIAWLAGMVGAGNCNTFSLSAALTVCGLLYLCAIVPFKLGGAVMSGWGKLGAGAAKLGGNAAYNNPWAKANRAENKRKFIDWHRNSAIGKYALGGGILNNADEAKAKEARATALSEEDAALRTGKATQRFDEKEGRISSAEEMVKRQIGLKRVKEQVADLDLSTREGLSEAANRMANNGDQLGYNALLEHAAENAMVADVMQEAGKPGNEDMANMLRKKYNMAPDFDFNDTSLEGQQRFIAATVKNDKGQEDLRAENRIQEAWVKSGIANAKNIVADASAAGGFRRLDLNNADDKKTYENMTVARFLSPDAHKSIRTLRKETLFDKDKKLTTDAIQLLQKGLFSDEHIRMLSRGRSSLLNNFNEAGNIERLEASGDPKLLQVANKLRSLGYGTPAGHDQVVVSNNAGQMQNRAISEVNIDDMRRNPQITQRISERITENPAINLDQVQQISQQVESNLNFEPSFKAHIRGLAELKKAEINAQGLNQADATTTQTIIDNTARTIQNEIGNSLQNGIEISPIINQIIGQVKGPTQALLRQKIKESIANSDATVIDIPNPMMNGKSKLTAKDIIESYNTAQQKIDGRQPSADEVKIQFISRIQSSCGAMLSGAELERAERLINAYEGKPANKPSPQKSRERYENIVAQQAADEAAYDEFENP